ncbi:hypothetical protein OKW42_000087 [Paraburkholderia sp. WC7.3d]
MLAILGGLLHQFRNKLGVLRALPDRPGEQGLILHKPGKKPGPR